MGLSFSKNLSSLEEEWEPTPSQAKGVEESAVGPSGRPGLRFACKLEGLPHPGPLGDRLWRRGWSREVGHRQRVPCGQNCFSVDPAFRRGFLDGVGDVNVVFALDQLDQLVRILTYQNRAEVAGHVVPRHSVAVLVVQSGQAGFVVVFLPTLDRDPDVVLSFDLAIQDAFKVVRLGLTRSAVEKLFEACMIMLNLNVYMRR